MSDPSLNDGDRLERLGQATSVGVLADRVLLAVERMRAGADVSDDEAVGRAEDMLRGLAKYSDSPFDVTQSVRLSPVMRLLREEGIGASNQSRHTDTSSEAGPSQAEWLSQLAQALSDMRSGSAHVEQLDAVRALFDILSGNSLETAIELTRADPVGRWTRAQVS